jgi:hypothetical protein
MKTKDKKNVLGVSPTMLLKTNMLWRESDDVYEKKAG